ncbi:hypothetical protein H696_00264 [Fonticula alba]|uniref:Uncharacterized protein n=1 Tax=Fonticula alba TaxID=691883 RepID=A0A058ZE57_FONAL|nr:hypothetical protein H696_00264 [Fonticula alba]KCV72685.1 hypothetical protein H696_00264 [Fonticula alba]|eukprot:XP_009492386.1 hypothetical protein H696_00264 [Fonticula alba]
MPDRPDSPAPGEAPPESADSPPTRRLDIHSLAAGPGWPALQFDLTAQDDDDDDSTSGEGQHESQLEDAQDAMFSGNIRQSIHGSNLLEEGVLHPDVFQTLYSALTARSELVDWRSALACSRLWLSVVSSDSADSADADIVQQAQAARACIRAAYQSNDIQVLLGLVQRFAALNRAAGRPADATAALAGASLFAPTPAISQFLLSPEVLAEANYLLCDLARAAVFEGRLDDDPGVYRDELADLAAGDGLEAASPSVTEAVAAVVNMPGCVVEADPDADEMDRTIGSLRRVYQRICVAYILSQCAGTFQSSVLSSEQRQQTADEVLAQAVDSLRDKARSIHQSYIRLKTASDPGDQLEIIRSDAMAAWTMYGMVCLDVLQDRALADECIEYMKNLNPNHFHTVGLRALVQVNLSDAKHCPNGAPEGNPSADEDFDAADLRVVLRETAMKASSLVLTRRARLHVREAGDSTPEGE